MNHRIHEIDITRGLFIVLVTWVHVTFFIGARSLGEIYFDTTCLPEMSDWFYVCWVLSEQLAPAGFFLMLGVSLAISRDHFTDFRTYFRHHLKRAGVLFLLELIIRPWWLLTPLDALTTCSVDSVSIFFVFGIYINLGLSIILSALASRVPSFYLIILAVTGLVWSGMVDIYDDFFDDYHSVVTSLFLLPGTNFLPGIDPGIKTTFNIIPWVSYSIVGLLYGRVLLKNPQGHMKKELFFAGLIIANVILIRMLGMGPADRFWFLSKYPPNLLLTGGCLVFTLVALNIFRLLSKYNLSFLSILDHIGRNSLSFYSIHFPVFILIGFGIKKISGGYVENNLILHLTWIGGLYAIYRLTLIDSFNKFTSISFLFNLFRRG